MKQSITPQIALVSQSTAGRRLFALGIISIIAVATRTRTRTLTRSRSRSNRLHFAARMPRRRRLWCPRPWRSRTHDSENPLQPMGAARRRGWQRGWLCSMRVSSLSPSLDLSSLPAISRCVIAFKCLPHHAHCLLHMWVVSRCDAAA